MVTHDRYFLDRVTNKILEISHGKIYTYEAKYSDFLEMKAQREEMEMASERKKQSILRMEVEWQKEDAGQKYKAESPSGPSGGHEEFHSACAGQKCRD